MREDRPAFATSYGISDQPSGMVPWADSRNRLLTSRNYWIATADTTGTPHSSPVWGVWFEDRLYFGTDVRSKKANNLQHNPRAVVHLESGDDVVIVHCEISTVEDTTTIQRVLESYRAKYDLPSDFEFSPMLCAVPVHGFAWKEAEFPTTATKYFP